MAVRLDLDRIQPARSADRGMPNTSRNPPAYLSDPISSGSIWGEGRSGRGFVNGSIGVRWMHGQQSQGRLREGNELTIEVTNTLINRVSHFTEQPPLPVELIPHYGGRLNSSSDRRSSAFGFEPLPASGLLGPVKILLERKIRLDLK
jgi:hypothetical protein